MDRTPRVPQLKNLDKKWGDLFEMTLHDSDMASAIVITAFIDHFLAALLREHFCCDSTATNYLDPIKSPAGTLSAKTRLAYCLGFISKTCMENILCIGDIRNIFGHEIDSATFASPHIKLLCEKLRISKTYSQDSAEDAAFKKTAATSPRKRFEMVAYAICGLIASKTRDIKKAEVMQDNEWDD